MSDEKELSPGRELDALIAEKVMGFEIMPNGCECGSIRGEPVIKGCRRIPYYSYQITAALEVVEKIGRHWSGLYFCIFSSHDTDIWEAGWYEQGWEGIEPRCVGRSKFLAYAICIAALQVVKANKGDV